MNPRAFISTRAYIANTAYSTADKLTPTTATLSLLQGIFKAKKTPLKGILVLTPSSQRSADERNSPLSSSLSHSMVTYENHFSLFLQDR